MKSSNREEVVKRTTCMVVVCAVVNILGSTVIALVLIEHMHLLHDQSLDLRVEVKGQFENKSELHSFASNQVSLGQPITAPDAVTNELQAENQSAFDPLVVLKVMTDDPPSLPSDSSGSQNSIKLSDSSDPADSPAMSSSSVHSTHHHVKTHLASRKQRKRPVKAAMHDTFQIPKKSAKQGKSMKPRVPKKSKVLPATHYPHESRPRSQA